MVCQYLASSSSLRLTHRITEIYQCCGGMLQQPSAFVRETRSKMMPTPTCTTCNPDSTYR